MDTTTGKNKSTFTAWKLELDAQVQKLCGLSVEDLPDCTDQYGMWDGGIRPKQAALFIVTDAGFYDRCEQVENIYTTPEVF
jgi:hypothetical protein